MVPRTDHRLHGRINVFQHARQAVAVAVIPATDVITGRRDVLVFVFGGGAIPERPVALLLHVFQHARLGVEPVCHPVVVELEVGRAGHGVIEVMAHHPRIGVNDAVHVMHVLEVEVLGRHHRDEGFERRRVAGRHLDGIEAAPGDAEHADVAVGPVLLRQPVDHFLAVVELDVGVLVGNRVSLTVAGATNIDPRHDVTVIEEIGVHRVIAIA